jgi:hypothetical protein
MKLLLVLTLFLMSASIATAETRVDTTPSKDAQEAARQAAYDKQLNDHPKTVAMHNPSLRIVITTDQILRSCCRPPDLVVAGKITNVSGRRIDSVHLVFAFEDEDGRVLSAESVYNHKAESLSDDAEIQQILKEKPHFTPLAPGETDTFSMSVPLPLLPKFEKVEMFSTDIRP